MDQTGIINLRKYIRALYKYKRLILLISLISLFVITTISFLIMKPVYECDVTFLIGKTNENRNQSLNYDEIVVLDYQLFQDYMTLAKSRRVKESIIKQLKLDITPKALEKHISIQLKNQTRIIEARVTYYDSALAKDITETWIQLLEEDIDQMIGLRIVTVIDEPKVVEIPIHISRLKAILIGTGLSIGLSILGVFIWEFFDYTIKIPEDIEIYLKSPIICASLEKAQEMSLDIYRMLITTIKSFDTKKKIKSLVITSFTEEREKGFIPEKLSIALERLGIKVLLVDLNFKAPKVHTYFGLSNSKGFSNIILEGLSYKECRQYVRDTRNLDIISSGPIGRTVTKLIKDNKIDVFLIDAMEEYDLVIFDGPPLANSADTIALCTQVAGVVIVTEPGITKIKTAQQIERLLTTTHSNVIGIVLNEQASSS